MLKFIRNLFSLALLVTILFLGVFFLHRTIIGSQYQYNFQASLVDKVNRLKSINEPKIILVGNSNVAFGFRSDIIEQQLGMPVVNLGLHAGLGNAYHEQICKLGLNKGDIVVVCHSDYSDEDIIEDTTLAWITYDYHDELWPIIRFKDYKDMLMAYPTYFKKSWLLRSQHEGNKDTGGCYSRSAFNEYGDVIFKHESGQMDVESFFASTPITVPEINDTCINRLNKLNDYCTGKGASMVIAGYPIAFGQYAEFNAEDFVEFKNNLDGKLDCDVISDFSNYFYPYNYFYDTSLHLTEEGAIKRSEQLSSDLNNWIELNYEFGKESGI